MAILTDTKARNLRPDSPAISHGGVAGLTLHPSSTKGRGKWVYRYVSPVTKKRRNAGMGTYPEISIAEAGKLAQSMCDLVKQGLDPLEERAKRNTENQLKNNIPTFQQAALAVHTSLLPSWKNKRHQDEWLSSLHRYVFDVIGKIKVSDIQPIDIANILKPIWLEKYETASRIKQRIHAVMAWSWAHGFTQSNPVDIVDKLLPPLPSKIIRVQHLPAMPWKEIPKFINNNISNKNHYDTSRAIILFIILTVCRSGEARGMQWSEIDWQNNVWTIPADRMKTNIIHRVPLCTHAIELLNSIRGLHDTLVFPSPRKQTILSDTVMTMFLRKHNAPSDTPPNRVATAHGFRSSFRDWCSEQGYARDLAERALAHTVANQVEAAYHRTDLLEQRRPMMQAWADFVMDETPQPENV